MAYPRVGARKSQMTMNLWFGQKVSKYSKNDGDDALRTQGSTPREFAYIIHTDIGDKFMHAVDARKNMRISSDYELCDGDIIRIVTHG